MTVNMMPAGLLDYFVRHRTAANLILLMMCIAGVAAGLQIRAQFFPDVVRESVNVTVLWTGASAEDADSAVVGRIDPPLRALDGVEEITSTSRAGTASIRVDFVPGWDMAQALDDVKAAVDEVQDLPPTIESPLVKRASFSDRVTNVVITGDVPLSLLDRYVEELKVRLFRAGVSKTTVTGISDPVIRVDASRRDLDRFGLSIDDISRAIAAETGTRPIGEMNAGTARVTADSSRHNATEIGAIAVRTLDNGRRLLVRDVARVDEEGLDRGKAVYNGEQPAVVLRIYREASGDALELQATVERVVAEMRNTLPVGVTMRLAQARAEAIRARLDVLTHNGLLGLGIVLVLLFLFLSARTAFWVAAGIPVAMAATIALMWVFGLTINMVSLFALIISLGIIVDDAIVVGEHADALASRGLSPADAAVGAARRMIAPVFAASITTVVAFVSLVFVGGRFGDLIGHIPITVGVVIIASLIECFLILPAHMRHALTHGGGHSVLDWPSRMVNRGFAVFRERVFRPFMSVVLFLRYPLVAGVTALLMVSVAALMDKTVPWKFFSAPERGTIRANIAMLPGASRDDTRDMLREMDRAMHAVSARLAEKHGTDPLVMMLSTVGGTVGRGLTGANTKDPDLLGGAEIELIDPDLRPYSAYEVIGAWREEINSHPLLETLALRRVRSGPGGDDIDVRFAGADAKTLKLAAEELKSRLARLNDVSAVEDTLVYDKPEFAIHLTERGEALGFSTERIATELRRQLTGATARTIVRGSRDVDIEVRLPDAEVGASFLDDARLPAPGGGSVALSAIARVSESRGFASVIRKDGERVVNITGELSDNPVQAEAVIEALQREILPGIAATYDVTWTLGGLKEQEREFLSDAVFGFALCLITIYFVLAWVFGSWTRPAVILLVIPLGFIGALWGHYLHNVPLSMFSVVGLIGMAGIIINDSIILITNIDERHRHSGLKTAVINGAADRLRAVLLTSLTTVGGLAPLLFEQSRQALFLKPTVITLVYGLGFGVVLVLCVTPSLVLIQYDIRTRLRSARRLVKHLGSGRRRRLNAAPEADTGTRGATG